MKRYSKTIDSPVGILTLVAEEDALVEVLWPEEEEAHEESPQEASEHPVLRKAAKELTEYFAGKRKAFTVSLRAEGTDFQKRVWRALQKIPFGQTWSYGQQAAAMGQPEAVRAVGRANGRNPLPVFIPCHRVIGADGSLTGFGGGLPAKALLLSLERGSLFA